MIEDVKTLVPTATGQTRKPSEERLPVLRVLHHPNLARIGAATPQGLLRPRHSLRVGRLKPEFFDPDSGCAEPLADPCVSREQLTVTWNGRETFAVSSGGARSVELFRLDGTAVRSGAAVAPGTVIAIGNRVLLLLQMGRPRDGQERLGLVGQSEVMWELRDKIIGAAGLDGVVLIHGESGVGKEFVARAVHQHGARRDAPLLALNCAAIPEHLLESELFGHVRGAFTGATTDKPGLLRAAGGGTLLLDEIGELPLSLQSKMLRALQERAVRPVGAVSELPVDARIIAVTNRDLPSEIVAGRFREDLYYRLSAFQIHVPALRERREDVALLFRRFLRECTERHPELKRFWRPATVHSPPVPAAFLRSLLAYHWPGNVRHLRNVVERTAIANVRTGAFVVPEEVSAELSRQGTGPAPAEQPPAPADRPGDIDDRQLLALLEKHDYVQRRVAKVLGVSHTTVNRRMCRMGLRRPRDFSKEELAEAARRTGGDLERMAHLLRVSRRGLRLRLVALGLLDASLE